MIWLFLTLAAAKPVTNLSDISEDRKNPTTVWFTEPIQPLDSRKADRCEEGILDWSVPAGTRAHAHVVTPSCGTSYVFLDMLGDIGPNRTEWVRVRSDQVSLTPPARAPKWGAAVSEAFIYGVSSRQHKGIPMDDPDWEAPYIFLPWEPVEVIDPELAIVRTQGGRVLQVAMNWVTEEDRLVRDNKLDRRRALDRLMSTRAKWEAKAPIQPVPAQQALVEHAKDWAGRVYALELDGEGFSHPVYDREWIDPVGHRYTNPCDDGRRDTYEPCGSYQLDYTPFGAWVPQREQTVLARFDGIEAVDGEKLPKLTLLVRGPFHRTVHISDEWAPRE